MTSLTPTRDGEGGGRGEGMGVPLGGQAVHMRMSGALGVQMAGAANNLTVFRELYYFFMCVYVFA